MPFLIQLPYCLKSFHCFFWYTFHNLEGEREINNLNSPIEEKVTLDCIYWKHFAKYTIKKQGTTDVHKFLQDSFTRKDILCIIFGIKK
jgi:hypothetical protein